MKRLIQTLLLLTTVLTGLHGSASAWGLTGHRIVAEIAQRHLSKKAQKNLEKLIGKAPLAFWSNWPDFIKSDTTDKWKQTDPWHYVDLPGHIDRETFIQGLKALEGKNLYTQIPEMEALLQNKELPLEQRQIALRFLIHFIGDLHQPLHVGRDEDAGGNKIKVVWFGQASNLHKLWDKQLIDFQQWSYTEYADNIDTAGPAQIARIQSGTLEDWFYESHVLSDEVYDKTPDGASLGYEYNYWFFDSLNKQLLGGGLRLAAVLNRILG